MKRILFSFTLMLLACNGFAQKGFGIDGSFGAGRNAGDLVYPFLLEGRIQFNDYFSMNLGFGLWNSGIKGSWKEEETETSALYSLSSNKTLLSMQLSTRGQIPVFRLQNRQIRLFVEPRLYFLPFSAQTVNLRQTNYDLTRDPLSGEILAFKPKSESKTSMKSECHPRFYGGLQVGLAFELVENVDLAISYGYTNMDLFKDLRNQSIKDKSLNEWDLNPYLPRTDLQLINFSFLVNFNLN